MRVLTSMNGAFIMAAKKKGAKKAAKRGAKKAAKKKGAKKRV
jgi:hypothetical protein